MRSFMLWKILSTFYDFISFYWRDFHQHKIVTMRKWIMNQTLRQVGKFSFWSQEFATEIFVLKKLKFGLGVKFRPPLGWAFVNFKSLPPRILTPEANKMLIRQHSDLRDCFLRRARKIILATQRFTDAIHVLHNQQLNMCCCRCLL